MTSLIITNASKQIMIKTVWTSLFVAQLISIINMAPALFHAHEAYFQEVLKSMLPEHYNGLAGSSFDGQTWVIFAKWIALFWGIMLIHVYVIAFSISRTAIGKYVAGIVFMGLIAAITYITCILYSPNLYS